MCDRVRPLLLLASLAACGPEAPVPTPPPLTPEAPVTPPAPKAPVVRALAVDAAGSWLTLEATDGERSAEPELSVRGGAIHLVDDAVERVELELADIHIGAELLPPRGLDIVDPRLTFVPAGEGLADLTIRWSVLDRSGAPRAIRPIELAGVRFDVATAADGAMGIDGLAPGTVWRLDGLFELSNLAYSVVAH
ncbi:MAG: hypothetical protein RMA76_31100 [Deltaproteobacteria bacterium]|jgi:hypothetical protein